MTFDEYNTDEVFKGDSTADELVKKGYDEGKTREEIETSLSPLWKEDKKGNVKKALDKYYTVETPKKEEVKETETPAEPFKEEETAPQLTGRAKTYADNQDLKADVAQEKMIDNIDKNKERNWRMLKESDEKRAEAYKGIDDHYLDALPTFSFHRFMNGEFGDPKGKDAKIRLAYYMINGLQSKLKTASNLAMANAGRSPMFSDTRSDFEKFQESNFNNALENRWNKYKSDTEGAIKAVEKEYGNEQDARLAAEQFTRDKKANTYWNMMDQDQKVYAMQVSKEIGDMLGGMDTKELASFIAGSALNGNLTRDELIGVGIAQLFSKYPDLMDKYPSAKSFVTSLFGAGALDDITAGIGGNKTDSNGNQTNLTGNIQNYKTIGGDEVSFDFSDSNAGKKIQAIYDDLIDRYKKGEIDEETFKQYYDPIYAESKKHPGSLGTFVSSNSDKAIEKAKTDLRVELSDQIEALNAQAKSGEIEPSKYEQKFKEYREKAVKYGASEKDLKSIDNNKVSSQTITKAAEKKEKKETKAAEKATKKAAKK